MDKETLSNYGWIVICVLVMAVMIALATPFGSFISEAVQSTTKGLFDVNKSALDSTGLINIDNQEFDVPDMNHGAGESGAVTKDPALNPDDGTTPQDGNTYEYGDYKYTYYSSSNGWWVAINTNVTDKNQTTYGAILESINGEPVTVMQKTFYNCKSLTTAPVIPNSVTTLYQTFFNCTKLTTAPIIPSSVTNMVGTFQNCTSLKTYVGSTNPDGDFSGYILPNSITSLSDTFNKCTAITTAPSIPNSVIHMSSTFAGCTALTTAPVIPNSVTNMSSTFFGCTALTTAPVIPNNVIYMSSTFYGCTALAGSITINATPTDYSNCLYNTRTSEILGSCGNKSAILATK